MALETLMTTLIASLDANTAALKLAAGAGAATATTTKATTTKATGTTKTPATVPGVTFEAVKAAAVKVKEKSGTPVSKKIIADHGKAESLNAVKPENYAALLKACEEHLAAPEEAAEEPEAEDDL